MGDYDSIIEALDKIDTTLSTYLGALDTNFTALNTKIDTLLTSLSTVNADVGVISTTLMEMKDFILVQLANFDTNMNNLTRLEDMKQRLSELNEKLAALEPAFGKTGPQNIAQNIQDLRDVMEESFEDTKKLMRRAGLR